MKREEEEEVNNNNQMSLHEEEQETEEAISGRTIEPWTQQITVRGVLVSIVIGVVFSVIAQKLNLTTGIVPNLNSSAALLAFVFVQTWTKILKKSGYVSKPFTPQENTMIQTSVVACYGIAVGGGFASYLLGLNHKTYVLSGVNMEGNSEKSVKEPGLGWMTAYLFVVCFIGLFVLIPLRKVMIIDLKLTYPSGLATAVLINGFHTQGDAQSKKQVRGFMKYFSFSFFWGFFQWFFSGIEGCGFSQFPTFGLKAWKQTFFFDFSMTFVGAGMICSHLVNISLLLGAILSYGLMWPLLDKLKGSWFPENLDEHNMKSIYGYKVFLSVALILGDGLYTFVKIIFVTIVSINARLKNKPIDVYAVEHKKQRKDLKEDENFLREKIPMWIGVAGYLTFAAVSTTVIPLIFPQLKWYYVIVAYMVYGYKVFLSVALILGDGLYTFVKIMFVTIVSINARLKNKPIDVYDVEHKKQRKDLKEDENFLREKIPMWIGVAGYLTFAAVSTTVIPLIFPQLKWYYVIVAYIFAPSLAFCNAYGAGLTDINMAYNYGKIGLFVIAALTGRENGVVAGLAGCGLIKSVVSVSCILMQDFKTAHYTMTSPRAMFASQVIGTIVGCIVTPLGFFLFYRAFDVGNPNGEFKAPYALIYRNMAILGVQGFSALPLHCVQMCYGFFGFAVFVNVIRDLTPTKIGRFMPLPTAMAVPFLVGAYFAIDMCVGTLIVFIWEKRSRKKAEVMVPAVASGLICGEGLWTLPAAVLALAGVKPPICMKFLAS